MIKHNNDVCYNNNQRKNIIAIHITHPVEHPSEQLFGTLISNLFLIINVGANIASMPTKTTLALQLQM